LVPALLPPKPPASRSPSPRTVPFFCHLSCLLQ
jgi:hypothetical protein